jgi:hypothetical protein
MMIVKRDRVTRMASVPFVYFIFVMTFSGQGKTRVKLHGAVGVS